MKKTKIIFFILFLGFFYPFHSFAEIIKQEKTTDENPHFNVFLDFSNSIHSIVKKEFYEGSHFSDDDLNLEIIGRATDKISYRFTKQLKKTENSEMIDLAYLKYKWNDKLYFLFGKQPFSFGSMEYVNSVNEHAYRHPNVHKNQDNPVGFSFIYIPIKDHEFQFQIVNIIKNHEKYYVTRNLHHPMGYSVNWNWSILNNKMIQNRWSYSFFHFQESEKEKFWKFLALGSKLNLKPFSIEADYILSDKDIEKNQDLTKIFQSLNNNNNNVPSAKYGTYLVKLKYNFIPRWNFIVKGGYETGISKQKINDILEKNKLFKKEYTYYGGVEFLPLIENDDLSFHFLYKNQRINYSLNAIQKENKHFIILGFSYRIKMI
jgi:hypothetical protein